MLRFNLAAHESAAIAFNFNKTLSTFNLAAHMRMADLPFKHEKAAVAFNFYCDVCTFDPADCIE